MKLRRPDKAFSPPSGTTLPDSCAIRPTKPDKHHPVFTLMPVLSLSLRQKAFQYNQRRADTDRAIGGVGVAKCRYADVKIDHIDNKGVPQAVEQVTQRAADD